MELFVFVIVCVINLTILMMWILDWYDFYKEQKSAFIKDEDWLRMDDKTTTPYTTGFAQAKYIRPSSYIQSINTY